MIEVIEKTDKLIDDLNDSKMVKDMKKLKQKIDNEKLINTTDVKVLYENPIICEYVRNQNDLDMYIYYLNKKISNIIGNKGCSGESN